MAGKGGEKLAIDGGPKAFAGRTGVGQPKVGVEDFLAIAERFQFSPPALERLRAAVSDADLPAGGPHLGRYYGSASPSKGEQFEGLAREVFQVKHAFPCSSGTGALHAAFVAAGVGPGTEVICPALGFAATAMAVVLAGGVPVFCDVDESLHLDPAKLEGCVTPRTVAIAPTHHWGGVTDMAPVLALARRRGLKVVEDCAQAPGATYRGRPVGSIGDLGCFSISCYKIIGGGEGGMVVSNDAGLFERACQLAEGGGLWRNPRFAPPRHPGELFVGTNYRLSELESAINVVQLRKLEGVVSRHRQVSRRICGQLADFAEVTPQKLNDREGVIGYMLRFFPATCELSACIVKALQAEGIGAGTRGSAHDPDWHMARDMFPIVLKPGSTAGGSVWDDPRYRQRGGQVSYAPEQWPVAVDLFGREVSIGFDQWWNDDDCDRVAAGINTVLSAYCTKRAAKGNW